MKNMEKKWRGRVEGAYFLHGFEGKSLPPMDG
jgi:hypothetical protein